VTAPTSTPIEAVHREEVMGTVVSFHVTAPSEEAGTTGIRRACDRLHELDALLSLWRPESAMSRVRDGRLGVGDAPSEIGEVLDLCRAATALTGGWFDPWAMPGGVDPTGLAKGWALEQAAALLLGAGCTSATVNGGGDVVLVGAPASGTWRVGIRHPWRPDALAAVVLADHAVATSGSYERGAHLVDPRRGAPTLGAASATVVGDRLAIADALATGLAVGGDEVLAAIGSVRGYHGYLIRADGSEAATDDFPFAT
jgi:thiamine biosynthesis lipoprotein